MTLGSRSHEILPSIPFNHVTYAAESLKLLCLTVKSRCSYEKKHYLTFDLGVKFTQNVAHYLLQHVPYLATNFEFATSITVKEEVRLQET